ncbi:MAG: hypothetical protein LBB59_04090 [Campylobacteraceae bacterium]|jgi:hypothetical protein|nr:hypothetical protein [Campylobacteraceae bacterium]
MKKFFYLSVIFIFLAGAANAQSFDLTEQIKRYSQINTENNESGVQDKDTGSGEIESGGQSLFVSYESAPQRVYAGEIFLVKLKAVITQEFYGSLTANLKNSDGFRALNLKSEWEKDLSNEYYINTFYIQALSQRSKLPDFIVELSKDGKIIENVTLEGGEIEIIPVKGDAKFSHVVAQSLAVKSENTNKFDDKSLIVTLEIEAAYSNLREFNVSNGSVDDYKESFALQFIEYTLIVPNYVKNIDFTYFNTLSHNLQHITVPLNIKSNDLSTHTDLNPKESKFKLYKDILAAIALVFFIALFIYKRYKIAVVGAVLAVLYLFFANNPFDKVKLRHETIISILPAEKSSVFHITEGELEVEKLASKNGYIKILLPSGRIGWVKEEYAVEN